jgi:mRNA interferase MazF
MPPTTGYSFGDVVLVPFPFTDQAGTKKRPAVIISNAAYNTAQRDLVIMAVTSQLSPSGALGEALVADWQAAGLIKPSAIKPVITTIEQTLVIRRLGQLTAEDQQALRNAIGKIVG